MYLKGRPYVSWRVSIRYATYNAFRFTVCHLDREHGFARFEKNALARNSFPTAILQRLVFHSYGLPPVLPNIVALLRRTCTVCEYNATKLQRLTSTVCGKYCCLFALYMDRGYTPKQFVGLFDGAIADRQVNWLFASEFVPLRKHSRGGQCCTSVH